MWKLMLSKSRGLHFHALENIPTFRDPVQLNLLYEQSRKAIKIGAHPVETKIARQLAAFMLQMIYGDHNEAKHIPEKIE